MTDQAPSCSKCGGQMFLGFIANKTQGTTHHVGKWIAGVPVQAQVLGIVGANVEVGDRHQFFIRSYRCDSCGFLELYAVDRAN